MVFFFSPFFFKRENLGFEDMLPFFFTSPKSCSSLFNYLQKFVMSLMLFEENFRQFF
jgi:hypothetical protein